MNKKFAYRVAAFMTAASLLATPGLTFAHSMPHRDHGAVHKKNHEDRNNHQHLLADLTKIKQIITQYTDEVNQKVAIYKALNTNTVTGSVYTVTGNVYGTNTGTGTTGTLLPPGYAASLSALQSAVQSLSSVADPQTALQNLKTIESDIEQLKEQIKTFYVSQEKSNRHESELKHEVTRAKWEYENALTRLELSMTNQSSNSRQKNEHLKENLNHFIKASRHLIQVLNRAISLQSPPSSS